MIINKKSIYLFRIVSDLVLLEIVFIGSASIIQSFSSFVIHQPLIFLLFVLNISWILSAKSIKLYDDFRSRNYSYELINIIKNVSVQLIVSVVFLFFIKERLFNRIFIVTFILLLLASVGLKSYLVKKIMAFVRKKGKNVRRIVIVGASSAGLSLNRIIEKNTNFGYKVVGFIDDAPNTLSNNKYLGQIEKLANILEEKRVDDVVIALPSTQNEKVENIIRVCNKYAARVRIVPDYLKYTSKNYRISIFGDIPIITIQEQPLEEIQWRIMKRIFDIIFSLVVLTLVFPCVFIIVSFIQSLTSPGPIFFVQERIGRKNAKFRCYKFRSMHIKSSSAKEYRATVKDDPRITKLGKILRKTNLDELPQFINVLKGDMSIVGPRPHAISFNNKYSEYVEEIRLRHLVKPGITGWAQINGLRGDVSNEEENKKRTQKRIEYDLWYIENWSMGLDIQIIMLTVWRMLKGDPNAY
jgi:putative colanic acid biosynthesis UDP-glucose lipid carrier transferase